MQKETEPTIYRVTYSHTEGSSCHREPFQRVYKADRDGALSLPNMMCVSCGSTYDQAVEALETIRP